ncbi:ATP-binding protein [Psychroserpens luteolus]|uniref:ATP-binding protein n=1 Tax=Psychroserpens luteolus TaxID=2855840 RepID=UPI001E501B90|nr:ATP-binding protein [Psychroserpens luteolus]MCD2259140.1 response regulator [Psychroserpens luteolus]
MKPKQFAFLISSLIFVLSVNAQTNKDSLWATWSDESKPVIDRLEAIGNMSKDAQGMYRPANLDTAYYHAQQQYKLAETHNNKKYMGRALGSQGSYFMNTQRNSKAHELFKKSMAISEEVDDQYNIAASSFNIGIIYFKQSNPGKSIPQFERAASIFEKIGETRLQGAALSMIANLYASQQDERSVEYLNSAVIIFEGLLKKDDNQRDRMMVTMMKNQLNSLSKKYNLIEDTTTDSLISADDLEKLNVPPDAPIALSKAGEQALVKGDLTKAEDNFNESIKQSEELENKTVTAAYLIAAGQAFFNNKQYSKALPYFQKALVLANRQEILEMQGQIYAYLYEIHHKLGHHRQALDMFQKAIKIEDSIVNLENAKAIIQLKVESDYDKQKAIDDLKNEKEIALQEAKTTSQKRISWAIGIGLLLISILAYLIFNRLKETRKQKVIIEEQKKKVEQSEKFKEQFLANMSHEIRTPMHAISGMINILERNNHPKSQEVFLKAMRTSSDNLVVILNDVLDLSKIEAGKLDIESISLNLEAVVENVIQILKYKAEEKGLILSYKIADDVPILVMGDPTRLNQILINLVGNAIKFTEKGHVDILVSTANNKLNFEIKDTGIGIPKAKHESIFGAFEQAKDSTSRYYGGTGLGLNISKQLVNLQHGKIWIESEENKGSSFFFELPITIPEDNAVSQDFISEDQLKTMAESLKDIRILIAEDNPFNQMIARDDLSYYFKNVTIDTVENGALAIEKFKTNAYDLILMDVQMPETNGFEATKKIRNIEQSENKGTKIPIIAMTASLLKTEIDNCYNAGMNNYIPKPYKLEELIVPIFNALKS